MENSKITKIALVLVVMLIITISSVISTAVTYHLLKETKNDEEEIVTNSNLDDEIEDVEEINEIEEY